MNVRTHNTVERHKSTQKKVEIILKIYCYPLQQRISWLIPSIKQLTSSQSDLEVLRAAITLLTQAE